jgi:hypothetical protein
VDSQAAHAVDSPAVDSRRVAVPEAFMVVEVDSMEAAAHTAAGIAK